MQCILNTEQLMCNRLNTITKNKPKESLVKKTD